MPTSTVSAAPTPVTSITRIQPAPLHRPTEAPRRRPALRHRLQTLGRADDGMSTVEYAIGTLAAAAFAAILYTVVSGESVVTALTDLVRRALSVTF
ncbi:DUF4244 domain-containing protein [Pseudonocardia asaccharolytica]|uniref:DUF4244 domain-containing protein n=1 Tax=Pseudonocardia asaccharolytica DSM 44247 = NBRC 16224 TaxID=1123024 RepID=A0A511D0C2_9PSEU|nr:DUF4244 domain-containing protein [Pseudonocardia asaccharolytica]GEL18249.1 hypothetical protein PA7_20860 [Pseudonocardia asaccharolytica DSM 44247 = NBRC 16224]